MMQLEPRGIVSLTTG